MWLTGRHKVSGATLKYHVTSLQGLLSGSPSEVTTDYTTTINDAVLLGDGNITITLATASSVKNTAYWIKNIGEGTVTIKNAQGIDDVYEVKLAPLEAIHVISGGTKWWVMSYLNTKDDSKRLELLLQILTVLKKIEFHSFLATDTKLEDQDVD